MLAVSLLLAQWAVANAIEPPPTNQNVSVTLVGPGFIESTLPVSDTLRTALVQRDYENSARELQSLPASQLHPSQLGDRDFLLAWVLTHSGRTEEATSLIESVRNAENVPQDYLHLTLGELLVADGQTTKGANLLLSIDPESPNRSRAETIAGQAFQISGATPQAIERWSAMVQRSDPSTGSEIALWELAQHHGLKSDKAYPYLRRIWAHYPQSKEAKNADAALAFFEARSSHFKPSKDEIAAHGQALMTAGRYRGTIDFLRPKLERYKRPSPAACQVWYAYGRSNYKVNEVTRASQILRKSGEQCAGIDDDRGAKSFYLAGKSLERKKDWEGAAKAYQRIPELYPDHSMADDGYALAGIAWQEVGQPQKAVQLWSKQVKQYPEGDLAAEGFWRLAWTAYLRGDPKAAIDWAELMIWKLPVEVSPMHWMGAHYWSARWRLYPDVHSPTRLNPDEEQVEIGLTLLTDLVERYPSRFYSLLAAARLYELAPDRLAGMTRPAPTGHPTIWTVRSDFLTDEQVEKAIQLVRLGLVTEAMVALQSIPTKHLLPSEVALIAEIEREADWKQAHDRLHKYLLSHPAAELGPDRDRILKEAFPSTYWSIIEDVAQGYQYDARIFQALVREESSFNPDIVSHAGARGLSQLMPGTARRVADWLNIPISKSKMFEPETNLKIGSRYLEYLHDFFSNNHMLAVAGYNAGEGNVQKWHKKEGNIPTDEFVESIPFRETRRYVKRVLGTYQLYHLVYGQGDVYPDWSAFNHQAIPN